MSGSIQRDQYETPHVKTVRTTPYSIYPVIFPHRSSARSRQPHFPPDKLRFLEDSPTGIIALKAGFRTGKPLSAWGRLPGHFLSYFESSVLFACKRLTLFLRPRCRKGHRSCGSRTNHGGVYVLRAKRGINRLAACAPSGFVMPALTYPIGGANYATDQF